MGVGRGSLKAGRRIRAVLLLVLLVIALAIGGAVALQRWPRKPERDPGRLGLLTASLAAIVAEADWEPRANLWLGTWVLAAPWTLGFSHEPEATLVHVIGGALVSMLSAAEVWFIGRSPPWRFGPGAAQRAPIPECPRRPGELKHLSTRRKRKQPRLPQ